VSNIKASGQITRESRQEECDKADEAIRNAVIKAIQDHAMSTAEVYVILSRILLDFCENEREQYYEKFFSQKGR
jgi:hypothetical protein